MGANPAANHPISMKWVTRAQERGAKLVCVDPRFTQTAAKADLYAPIRSGTDIAFLGGLIHYLLSNDLIFRDYVVQYTDAPFLVNPDFKMPGDLDGVFSGYNAETSKYDRKTWSFQLDEKGVPRRDATLTDPNCVFQLLKKHYSRYTIDTVVDITGTPKEKVLAVYEAIGSTHKPDRVATVCYAMGWTQHTVGVQNIRAFTIVQLLLGNMGMAGGGVNALRGEGNVQGSTDHGLLFHILTGYLPAPVASMESLKDYITKLTPKTSEPRSVNWWSNRGKYITSYLKAVYGEKATTENDFGYAWIPKLDDGMKASWLALFAKMYMGSFDGFFCWGMNPANSSAGAGKVREALGKVKWMVAVDMFDHETASFWRGPGVNPKDVKTEVFLLPACSSVEKEGSISNSGRVAQWRYKAIEPIGQSMPDADILNELHFRVKALYLKEGGKFADPIVNLTWDYGEKDASGKVKHLDVQKIAGEINGYYTEDVYDKTATPPKLVGKKGDLVTNFVSLRDDGTTSSGNWLYCGSMAQKDGKVVEPDGAPRQGGSDRPRPLSELGVGVAGQPPGHLQPRLGRPERKPLGSEACGAQVECDAQRCRKAGRVAGGHSRRAGATARHREGWQAALHHEAARRGLDLRRGPRRRAAPGALRTDGKPGPGQPDVEEVPGEPDDPVREGPGQGQGPVVPLLIRLQEISLRGDFVSPGRALAVGQHDPSRRVAARDAAADVRRDGSGPRGRERHPQRRHGRGDLPEGPDVVPRARHGAPPADDGSRHEDPRDRDALALRLAVSRRWQRRRQRQPPDSLRGRSQRAHSRIEGLPREPRQGRREAGCGTAQDGPPGPGRISAMSGYSFLVDTSRCTGCRGCQAACKQWNENGVTHTTQQGTYQNPPDLDASTFKLVRFSEEKLPGHDPKSFFFPDQCRHCMYPLCKLVADEKAPGSITIDSRTRAVHLRPGGEDVAGDFQ